MPTLPANAPPSVRLAGAIRGITTAIGRLDSSDAALVAIAESVRDLIPVEHVAIVLKTLEGTQLQVAATAGSDPALYNGMCFEIAGSMAEEALSSGRATLTVLERAAGEISGGFPVGVGTVGVSAVAVAPIRNPGRILGAVIAIKRHRAFSTDEARIMEGLAGLVPVALDNYELSRRCLEQGRELTALYDTAKNVGGSLNYVDVFDSLINAVYQHLRPRAAALFLLNDERTHLLLAAEKGLSEGQHDVQLAADAPWVAQALQHGKPRLVTAAELEEFLPDVNTEPSAQCAALAPVTSRTDVLGVVVVFSTEMHAFSESDLQLLVTMVSQAGTAIHNAFLFDDVTRQSLETAALYELTRELTTRNQDRIYTAIANYVQDLMQVDKFALMLYDRQSERLVTRICRGVDPLTFGAIQPEAGEGIPGWVYRWVKPEAVTDVVEDERNVTAPLHQEGVASLVCVPIASDHEDLGVLLAMSSRRRVFSMREIQLLDTIGNQSAIAIENAHMYHEAQHKSQTMRRYFNRVADTLGSALTVADLPQVMVDLIAEMMQAARCSLYRASGARLELRASHGFRPALMPDTSLEYGEGLTGWVARRGRALAVEALAEDPRAAEHLWLARDRVASYLGVPLKFERRTVGVIEVFTAVAREFDASEIQLLTQFTRHSQIGRQLAQEMLTS